MNEFMESHKKDPHEVSRESGRKPRVAIVHYWLVSMRGGEKVIEILCDVFPDADIFVLVADFDILPPSINKHDIKTSFLQKIGGKRFYQKMLFLMPFALESFDLTGYDLVISSEAGPAKGVIPPPESLHICYCHSPMRYIWDLFPEYHTRLGFLGRTIMSLVTPFLRIWDVSTSARVDHFIANSSYVAKRIEKYYRRSATVIHPPVNVERFQISKELGDFFLCAGQITPYKRIELAVEAFTRNGQPLVVIGGGVTAKLRRMAGPNIRFLGVVDDDTLADHYARCRALIFPGVEDFGIVPVEVMASGRPVIAFAKGGALETVIDEKTGVLFEDQTVEGLLAAVERFESLSGNFDAAEIRAHACTFDAQRFRADIVKFINDRRFMIQSE